MGGWGSKAGLAPPVGFSAGRRGRASDLSDAIAFRMIESELLRRTIDCR